jgi:hypothetical protein
VARSPCSLRLHKSHRFRLTLHPALGEGRFCTSAMKPLTNKGENPVKCFQRLVCSRKIRG